MDVLIYKIGNWMESYKGIYTIILLNCIVWIGYVIRKGGLKDDEHLKQKGMRTIIELGYVICGLIVILGTIGIGLIGFIKIMREIKRKENDNK